jgi:hypothetical protein
MMPSVCRHRVRLREIALCLLTIGMTLGASSAAQAETEEPAGPFAVETFTTSVSTTQAGAHPDLTTSIRFASHLNGEGQLRPNQGPQDVIVNLPPGLVGNLTAAPTCSTSVFETAAEQVGCPAATQVGTADDEYTSTGYPVGQDGFPVVLLEHGAGEVARLGVEGTVPFVIDISVRTSGDYGLTASIDSIPVVGLISASVTLWGIPAQHYRGCPSPTPSKVIEGLSTYVCQPNVPPAPASQWLPFMTNPTTCPVVPLTSTLSADSNQDPEHFIAASAEYAAPTGCGALAFDPGFTTTPDTTQADAPSGYTFGLTVPQNLEPEGFANSELRTAVVTLPPGVTVDPSAAAGLQACSDAQFGMGTTTTPSCPSSSVIGSDEVISPDVPNPLNGQLYVGQPEPGNMYRIFQYIEGDGLNVKLEGRVSPNPVTGQITATFENLPQLPFSELKLRLKGGNAAVLANSPTCGLSTTATALTPWSGNSDAIPSSSFETSADGQGAGCPVLWPLSPELAAGSNSLVAGANTTFSLTVSRADRTQYFGGLSAHLPPGLLGDLQGVPLCPSALAVAGACPLASQIGTVRTEAGVGETPIALSGTVYLAQPRISNSPASLSVVVPAIAGPYNLGNVVVGADIRVNNDGSVTVSSDPLPTILDGVPVRIRQIGVDVTRPGFMINPTSCAPMSVDATILSTQGESAGLSSPFQLADCQSLPFSPELTASTQAKTSKRGGASLDVRIASGSSQANIAKVDVALPKQFPARNTTLQQACTEAQFAANAAACPAGSVVGTATAHTPLLNGPLTGPAILVSGGAAFPDLVLVLQGQGITIELTGSTDIKKGIIYSKFEAVPDVPVSAFELELPEGPYSLLATNLPAKANDSMCGQTLAMPTTITAQNGAQLTQQTRITTSGCPKGESSLSITRAILKGSTILVTVNTTAEGTVTISGRGLRTRTKRHVEAGTGQMRVLLTSAEKILRGRPTKIKVRASLAVGKQVVTKTTSVDF